MLKIAVLVGSLRKDSYNRKMALSLMDMAPKPLQLEIVEIGELPLYNEDLDLDVDRAPEPWKLFRTTLAEAKGVLFISPEYNRSVPGVLKNAIDVGSRPYGKSIWKHKPAAVMTVSPGAIGGFGANHHLRQSLVFLDMPALQQPEAYIGHADQLFDGSGKVKDAKTIEFLQEFLRQFALFCEHQTKVLQ